MEKTIYIFDTTLYTKEQVMKYTQEKCDRFAEADPDYVTKVEFSDNNNMEGFLENLVELGAPVHIRCFGFLENPAPANEGAGTLSSTDKPRLTSVWARVGIVVRLTDEELEKVAKRNSITFAKIFNEGRAYANGDSYVPTCNMDASDDNDKRFIDAVGAIIENEDEVGIEFDDGATRWR